MTGVVEEDVVKVNDEKEGNRLYNKGYFGTPMSGGGVELELFEAWYLLEAERLELTDPGGGEVSREEIMKRSLKKDGRMAIKYPMYRDMRRRGYVVKRASDPADFRVFPRGGGPGKTPTKYWLIARAETDGFSMIEIEKIAERVSQVKKILLGGLVDEEGDVTYYRISTIDLIKGRKENTPEREIEGSLFGDRCYLSEDGTELHEEDFYGCSIDGRVQLSLLETLYLKEQDILKVRHGISGDVMDKGEIRSHAEEIQRDFSLRYDIYHDLREKGLIPKTGFKYGTVFRCYTKGPDGHHAEYMIQPVPSDFECSWYDVSRAVRVAHSVKKEFIFARNRVGEDDPVSYIKVERETP